MKIYNNIEDCTEEVENRCFIIDAKYVTIFSVYNAITKIIYFLNFCILITLIVLSLIFNLFNFGTAIIIYISSMLFECILSSCFRSFIMKDYTNFKLIIAQEIFNQYLKDKNLDNWEKDKIFNTYMLKAAGLKQIKNK